MTPHQLNTCVTLSSMETLVLSSAMASSPWRSGAALRWLSPASRVIDVGGGDSRLVDALLDDGVAEVTVLDVSAAALERAEEAWLALEGEVAR